MSQELNYIETKVICPHPDNPRKDLGDLTELSESIKVNGVLQNLTVIPLESGMYRVIIGHRRLAAAKLAGLETVPCVIADLTPEQQVATMLLENMQRSDLTVYEQAQGFQMMLDMGENVGSCAEKTGFLESTVRRRVKLLDLDQDEFKKSCERGATLQDYMELDKIEDPDLKNEVLKSIGTNNFKAELSNALYHEKARAWVENCVAVLMTFAQEVEEEEKEGGWLYQKYQFVRNFGEWNKSQGLPTTPEDLETTAYYYKINPTRTQVDLYKERQEISNDDAAAEAAARAEELEQQRRSRLSEITARAYELRGRFVAEVSNANAKKHIGEIIAFSTRNLMESWSNIDEDDVLGLLEVDIPEDEESGIRDFSKFNAEVNRIPEKAALILAYLLSEDSEREGYVSFNGLPAANETLDNLYKLLCKLGYEMSDEEQQLQDGTHPLFEKSEL